MANKSQENGTTILLGLKGYEVRMVTEGGGKIIVEAKARERDPVCLLQFGEVIPPRFGQKKAGAAQLEQWQKGLPSVIPPALAMPGLWSLFQRWC